VQVTYGAPAGSFPDGTWSESSKFYVAAGNLKGIGDPNAAYTNRFINKCNEFDHASVAAAARAFKLK
jgi:hypothetical protein